MKRAELMLAAAGLALAAACAADASAQMRGRVEPAPATLVSVWAGGYYSVESVDDGADVWDFGSSFAAGLGLHHRLGNSLHIGVDASFSPADYEITGPLTTRSGSGQLITALASGRLRYGGGAELSIYLTGGAGAFFYRLSDHDISDTDLALLTGAGLEYRVTPRFPLFVEWGRYWVFHQEEGVSENTAHHSHLRVGARWGL